METSERIIAEHLADKDSDPEVAASKVVLDYLVCRHITCPLCGRVLDTRKAVIVEREGSTPAVFCITDLDDDAGSWAHADGSVEVVTVRRKLELASAAAGDTPLTFTTLKGLI